MLLDERSFSETPLNRVRQPQDWLRCTASSQKLVNLLDVASCLGMGLGAFSMERCALRHEHVKIGCTVVVLLCMYILYIYCTHDRIYPDIRKSKIHFMCRARRMSILRLYCSRCRFRFFSKALLQTHGTYARTVRCHH
jgi:hypothetical protein